MPLLRLRLAAVFGEHASYASGARNLGFLFLALQRFHRQSDHQWDIGLDSLGNLFRIQLESKNRGDAPNLEFQPRGEQHYSL